ncbi:uncharacterized protein LOC123004777 [Tribolium madens]|uniref:uncharacterized protein LOC123004777 n=1 Tax=Tribolium madens TaxID=41895 RepID=UPI001CF7327D|nr:uncharacterized protein LOC123004777 [Tribolium madens]
MLNQNIATVFVLLTLQVVLGVDPQVYENVDETIHSESNTRVARDPFNHPKDRLYKPQTFNFQGAIQQNQKMFRYAKQQRVDMQNILKKAKSQVIDPAVSSSRKQEKYKLPQEKTNRSNTTSLYSMWQKISQLSSTKKPVTSRKLKPSNHYDDFDSKIKRQDSNHLVYIKNQRSEHDLNALNALVGQPPSNQLEGLKRLLESTQSTLVLPPIKGPLPTPVIEHSVDIPNPRTHPNVDQNLSLEALQSQLDENAKAQLAKALADAQQQALAHVEAQHQAIAKAQVEAQKKALAQIALHNQGIKAERLPQPLPLKQHVSQPLPISVQPLAVQLKQHQRNETAKTKLNSQKINPKPRENPNDYQQLVLETQSQNQKILPEVIHQLKLEGVDDHTYAARYAFGYKIRDVKMGNEFGHEEKREGENAKGHYHVLLPDGRMQKVEYFAGPSGYHAKVTYENLAHH